MFTIKFPLRYYQHYKYDILSGHNYLTPNIMNEGLSYLNTLGLHRVKPGLERITKLLRLLDNPHVSAPCVIIAGTNGKGSVASVISSVLTTSGYNTGLYTSPHLIHINERICIDGREIKIDGLSEILLRIKKTSDESLLETPSYFEVITAAAFVYFAQMNVDISVLEVGMGGRWDATNVITPLVSVITNVSYDHTEYLGSTIPEIAAEKACVIKPGVPVTTGTEESALEIIRNEAIKNNSPLTVMGKDFSAGRNEDGSFNYSGTVWNFRDLKSTLKGVYQLMNQAVAISALEALSKYHDINIDEADLREGLMNVSWGGRYEVLRDNAPLILDSAHNPAGAKALVDSIIQEYPGVKFNFLIGMLSDKNHDLYMREIARIADKITVTQVPSERTLSAGKLRETAETVVADVDIIPDYRAAFEQLSTEPHPLCITGSLYLIGAIKELLDQQS